MTTDPSFDHEADADDAIDSADHLVDWSQVEALDPLVEEVGDDKAKALAFYDSLATETVI